MIDEPVELTKAEMIAQFEKFQYALCAVDPTGKVLHTCMYEKEPDFEAHDHLIQELEVDPDHGLTQRNDWKVVSCPPDVFQQIKENVLRDLRGDS